MKKSVAIIFSIILVMAMATTVFAMFVDDPHGQKLIRQGYTEQDIEEINAIIALSDENVIGFITNKYDSLGDWHKVRQAYDIDETEYESYMEGVARWKALLDSVPENVMTEMKKEMSQHEISLFVSKINFVDVDFEYAWEQYKNGMSVEDIVKEKKTQNEKISELDTAYVMNNMSAEDYMSAFAEITGIDNNTTISDILMQVKQLRTDVRNRHRKQCGITDEEIAYCEARGMTNPMDMFQAKYISKANNISLDKVVATKLKNDDWVTATAEVLNIPTEEYKKQVEKAKAQ